MALSTIKIKGISLDVYYSYETINDVFGTGDSPTEYDITIHEIELIDSTVNILPLLENEYYDDIVDELLFGIKLGE